MIAEKKRFLFPTYFSPHFTFYTKPFTDIVACALSDNVSSVCDAYERKRLIMSTCLKATCHDNLEYMISKDLKNF